MITRPIIVITSLGRTGTRFFAKLFRQLLPSASSLHEPDIFNFSLKHGKGVKHVVEQIRESGFQNIILKKMLKRWSLIEISDARVRGSIAHQDALRQLYKFRNEFISSRPGNIYVESSTAHYGVIDILTKVYSKHRVVFIVRDGRDWVRSWMNWGERGGMYTKGKIRGIWAHRWPTANDFQKDPYSILWNSMSRFEKLCWAWQKLNSYALRTAALNDCAKVYRFEDIFSRDHENGHIVDLIEFATGFLELRDAVDLRSVRQSIQNRVHESSGAFPAYSDWSQKQKDVFQELCGTLMKQMEYDF